MCLKVTWQGGGSGVKKHVGSILNYSRSRATCEKPHQNIIPSESYEFLKIWVAIKLVYAHKLLAWFIIEYKRYIYLDTMPARDLKFDKYLP